jgi:hypothetical protein
LAASAPETPPANGVAPLRRSGEGTHRLDQFVHLAIGENDAAETARADLWSEFGIEYGCPAVEAQEECA